MTSRRKAVDDVADGGVTGDQDGNDDDPTTPKKRGARPFTAATLQGILDAVMAASQERTREVMAASEERTHEVLAALVDRLDKLQPSMGDGGAVKIKPRGRPFDGTRPEELTAWIFGTEEDFVALRRVDDKDKLVFAVTLLEGAALQWFQVLADAGKRPTTWTAFKDAIGEQFSPHDEQVRLRDELVLLRQTGSVRKYCDAFMHVFLRVRHMDEVTATQMFCFGLSTRLKTEVRVRKPKSLTEAQHLAQTLEEAYSDEHIKKQPTQPRQWEQRGPTSAPPKPTFAAAAAAATAPTVKVDLNAVSGLPILGKLSDAERARLTRLGGCFKCRQLGHRGDECPLPWPTRKATAGGESAAAGRPRGDFSTRR